MYAARLGFFDLTSLHLVFLTAYCADGVHVPLFNPRSEQLFSEPGSLSRAFSTVIVLPFGRQSAVYFLSLRYSQLSADFSS